MDISTFLGYLAGFLTTSAFLPQVIKAWKTKSTQDLSLGMWSIFCFGVFCWLIYGFMIHALPIILANIATLLLAGTILILKVKHK